MAKNRRLTPVEVSNRVMGEYNKSGGVMKDFKQSGLWGRMNTNGTEYWMEYFNGDYRITYETYEVKCHGKIKHNPRPDSKTARRRKVST